MSNFHLSKYEVHLSEIISEVTYEISVVDLKRHGQPHQQAIMEAGKNIGQSGAG